MPIIAPYAPVNIKETLTRDAQKQVDKAVDGVQVMSIGNFDGRYIGSYPGPTLNIEDNEGFRYHIVGFSRWNDMSVCGP